MQNCQSAPNCISALSGVFTEYLPLCDHLQDTSGSRVKDQPAAPSPVQISTAAPPSIHGKLLPPVDNMYFSCSLVLQRTQFSYADVQYVLQCLGDIPKSDLLNSIVFPAVHPHAHTAPPSALVPVMTTVAPQPGLPGSSHAFQVTFHHILYLTYHKYIYINTSGSICLYHCLLLFHSLTPTHRPL